ncbi:MAG: hypothetical protein WC976_06060 [Caldisericia bacterium]
MDNVNLAKPLGQAQCLLIKTQLNTLAPGERKQRLQSHWNMFQAIMDVSLERADVMYSKYATLVFTYQELFNVKGGERPKIEGLNLKADFSKERQEVVDYLDEMYKETKKKRR